MSDGKDDDKPHTGTDLARAAVVIGGPLVVSLFAAVGISGDYLTRAVRNNTDDVTFWFSVVIAGLVLPFIGFLLSKSGKQEWWTQLISIGGIALVLLGSIMTIHIAANSLSEREMPGITAETTWPEDDSTDVTITVAATGASLRAQENLLLRVIGIRTTDQQELDDQCILDDRTLRPTISESVRVLARGVVGPEPNGTAKQKVVVEADSAEFDFVCAYALLRDRDLSAAEDDRWAWMVLDIRGPPADES